jgi:hypothetical protein
MTNTLKGRYLSDIKVDFGICLPLFVHEVLEGRRIKNIRHRKFGPLPKIPENASAPKWTMVAVRFFQTFNRLTGAFNKPDYLAYRNARR